MDITSPQQLSSLLSSSRIVVVNFYNEWNAACKAINPLYETIAGQLSRPSLTFTRVNAEQQPQIATSYSVNNPPIFLIFQNGQMKERLGATNPQRLSDAIKRLAEEAESAGSNAGASGGAAAGSSSSGGTWLGADLPRGYTDVTDQVDVRGLDLLNADSDFGGARTLFESSIPTTVAMGKGKGAASGATSVKKDWVESDVDEQLMLYFPFISTVKVHTIQITSTPPTSEDDDEVPMRPKTIHIYTNRQHNLGFEEADDVPATQTIELKESDWDEKTGTAKLELRFVKFQNVYSLVLFVVDGDGDGEKTRIDRIRIIGESGEKRDPGKLEKIGDES
ncbi:DUF1000-domain-containing protein [Amniculicola lignicola CBS 123094]|uniref:DUF1000-domain-containing protein n=1 Tax=Amniculicola lignicola CBS 123094 TaxID=1392246 RepID=A0A6A5X0I9_9PLEO|nr:DUF1000-domain-containing protein [Amniculicola lignicola CBS 123094]